MPQEDAALATGNSIIVHHQTMTNKPHRHFQLGLVGGKTHQTEYFTTFVSCPDASGEGGASFLIPHSLPPPIPHLNLNTTGKRIGTQRGHFLQGQWEPFRCPEG